ncbi:hypothetical protein PHYPO_G00184860 [Pangasianodon hypophthalmus]|uniref:Probable arginine--tRNA ligase, mitochondrial n=1 Tax=Pangasianodon hypophthalmus TaxID=310915 RepID=A0A5N5JEF4_PANHP|nr:hypothetical protein PHYPO_G00184860 [Pangasianodon hypophthalmus]
MASFFRRSVSSQLVRICGGSEEVFIPLLSAVPVSKRQLTPDFRLTVSSLVQNGILSPEEDLLSQTERLAKQLEVSSVIEDVTAGRGVLTFRVNKLLLAQKVLSELREDPQAFGVKSEILRTLPRGRTLVEYSSPNIAKKFHAGHLRSTVIGHFIANLKQALGNDVIRRLGSEEKLKENALQHLFEVYVQANREAEHDESLRSDAAEFFRRLEQHEEQTLLLWKQFREITVQEYRRIYQSKTQEVLNDLRTHGLLKMTEKGTGVVDLSEQGDMSSYSTVLRSDGTSLYITRDVAAALERKQTFGFDEMIYVTDKSQSVHFQQLFQILRVMGHHWAQRLLR